MYALALNLTPMLAAISRTLAMSTSGIVTAVISVNSFSSLALFMKFKTSWKALSNFGEQIWSYVRLS